MYGSIPSAGSAWTSLIGELLAEQVSLTAVERFSQRHGTASLPTQARYYRDLIPMHDPQPGQQFGFEVDLDRCSGCKACVTACHSLNGLDAGESWREVGLLVSDDSPALQQTVTTACHHCVDPACLNGCPVLAYEKNPITGIVHHLDDQCIGCQYCVMKCPYEVPKYSSRLGIVRKCDLCSNRLAVGEAPACVQACPSEAIRVVLVDRAEVSAKFSTSAPTVDGNAFLPDSPPPDYTLPTTTYRSAASAATSLRAADAFELRPADPHSPLVFMLVLSQMAVGMFVLEFMMSWITASGETRIGPQIAGLVVLLLSIVAGTLHLGRPLQAWRSFLGWRKSWLSRELLVFGGMVQLALISCAIPRAHSALATFLTAAVGLLGVFCSVMIYVDTRRSLWRFGRTARQFFGSTLLLGAAALAIPFSDLDPKAHPILMSVLIAVSGLKIAGELALLCSLTRDRSEPDARSAAMLIGPLERWSHARLLLLSLGGIALPLFVLTPHQTPILSLQIAVLTVCVVAELIERSLYFRAVVPFKMPGGIAA